MLRTFYSCHTYAEYVTLAKYGARDGAWSCHGQGRGRQDGAVAEIRAGGTQRHPREVDKRGRGAAHRRTHTEY